MLKPLHYWITLALGALGLALVGANISLVLANRSLQAHLSARTQYLQQTQTIRALYQDIARALANLAVEHNDAEIKALLAEEGFKITPPAAPQVHAPPATGGTP